MSNIYKKMGGIEANMSLENFFTAIENDENTESNID